MNKKIKTLRECLEIDGATSVKIIAKDYTPLDDLEETIMRDYDKYIRVCSANVDNDKSVDIILNNVRTMLSNITGDYLDHTKPENIDGMSKASTFSVKGDIVHSVTIYGINLKSFHPKIFLGYQIITDKNQQRKLFENSGNHYFDHILE